MAHPSDQTMTIIVDGKMKQGLKCPVCLKLPRKAPVYQCEKGHCVCAECHSKLTNCPICRVALGKIRNLIFEEFLKVMVHKCKFGDYGCKFEATIGPLESHEKGCGHRLVNCPDLTCKTQVSMAHAVEHLRKEHDPSEHPNTRMIQRTFILKRADFDKDQCWVENHITFEDKHFFQECWRSNGGQWTIWVYMLGSRNDCEKQTYTIKLFSQDEKRKEKLTYLGYCVPLDMTKEQVASSGNCLSLTDAVAKRLMANSGMIKYSLAIVSAE